MESNIAHDFESSNNGDYKLEVREFIGGGVEAVLQALRPMQFLRCGSGKGGMVYASGEEAWNVTGTKYIKPEKEEKEEPDDFKKTANHQRSVRRASQNVRWNVRQMRGDRLFTLTYRENMEDRDQLKKDFKQFLQNVKRGWNGQGGIKDWKYVSVIERQDRGAYHIHCAVRGWQKISFLRSAWARALGGTGKETGTETLGNVDVTSPKKKFGTRKKEWKTSSLSAYITKYMAKTFDEESAEKKRYWHSKDLIVPVKERFVMAATDMLSAIKEASGVLFFNYGVNIDFTRSWMAKSGDCLWLSIGEA